MLRFNLSMFLACVLFTSDKLFAVDGGRAFAERIYDKLTPVKQQSQPADAVRALRGMATSASPAVIATSSYRPTLRGGVR